MEDEEARAESSAVDNSNSNHWLLALRLLDDCISISVSGQSNALIPLCATEAMSAVLETHGGVDFIRV